MSEQCVLHWLTGVLLGTYYRRLHCVEIMVVLERWIQDIGGGIVISFSLVARHTLGRLFWFQSRFRKGWEMGRCGLRAIGVFFWVCIVNLNEKRISRMRGHKGIPFFNVEDDACLKTNHDQ
jgi:hypothetical protein